MPRLFAAFATCVAAAAAAPLRPWPMRQANNQGTGQSLVSGPTSSAKTLRCSGVPSTASPAVGADGILYQPSTNGALFAIKISDGTLLWTFTPPGSYYAGRPALTPALSVDGSSIVYASAGTLFSLDSASGALAWSWNASLTPSTVTLGAFLWGKNDMIYVVATNLALMAINGANGTVAWTRIGAINDISLSSNGAAIFAVGVAPSPYTQLMFIIRVDAATGDVVWTQTMPSSTGYYSSFPAAPLVASDGQLIVLLGATLGSLSSIQSQYGVNTSTIDPATGSILLTKTTRIDACSQGGSPPIVSAPTLVMGSTIVANFMCAGGSAVGGTLGISVITGAQVWATSGTFVSSYFPGTLTSGSLPSPIAGADSTVYTSTSDGTVFGINSGTGAAIFTVSSSNTNLPAFSAIAGDKLLALGNCLFTESSAEAETGA